MLNQLVHREMTLVITDRLCRSLLDALCDCSCRPGQRITQKKIAQQLAVLRRPLLQAFRLMKKDDFVQDALGHGSQVTQLDAGWISNV